MIDKDAIAYYFGEFIQVRDTLLIGADTQMPVSVANDDCLESLLEFEERYRKLMLLDVAKDAKARLACTKFKASFIRWREGVVRAWNEGVIQQNKEYNDRFRIRRESRNAA